MGIRINNSELDNSNSEVTRNEPKEMAESDKEKLDAVPKAENRRNIPEKYENKDKEKLPIPEKDHSVPVYEGTARENPRYGEGGGKQYFIPDANEMKSDGRLEPVGFEKNADNPNKPRKDISDKDKEDIKSAPDTRPLSDDEAAEWEQLDENTPPDRDFKDGVYQKDKQHKPETPLSKEEIKQLDDNTIDEGGLSKVSDTNGKPISRKVLENEEYKKPHLNQEDSNGEYYPDGWKKGKLHDGDTIYQLSEDGKTPSSYFIDADTINDCRKEDGSMDFDQLKEQLQIDDSDNKKNFLTEYKVHI